MLKFLLTAILLPLLSVCATGQSSFNYAVELEPVTVPGLPGLHSYAFGQHNGKWLVIGGRKDGLHARQPFNSFLQLNNNTDIYVIDVESQQFWDAPLYTLPTAINEQLQSTNMNFYQAGDTLYVIGGYAFSPVANDHITFPNLTTIAVSGLIDAIVNGNSISPFFKQITDTNFAVTGGQLGKIGDVFYLVGGQRFDGRYNPMGNPTYTQTYTNQIRKFTINNSGSQLSYANYSAITDPIHLRRRDYNLLPQIFPDRTQGYTISSGVFQMTTDLPFLYPVDITENGYTPVTAFNQYLSNYHSAEACLYDSLNNEMHSLFFGGMSQYYYQNGALVQDSRVPFVTTISRLTRLSDGTLHEFQLPVSMPALQGASAEFIPNIDLPHYPSEIIKLSNISQDTILIGHILGGIYSPTLNPFSVNQTNTTHADNTIYAVKLIRNVPVAIQQIEGNNPYTLSVFPNPAIDVFNIEINNSNWSEAYYMLSTPAGKILETGTLIREDPAMKKFSISVDGIGASQTIFITVVLDNTYFLTAKAVVNNRQ